jgi:hypothetical protein
MQLEVFQNKAKEMGDFYVYFTRPDKTTGYFVATADLNNAYIHEQMSKRKAEPLNPDQVRLWNWSANSISHIDVKSIKKLVPLASVLKNG